MLYLAMGFTVLGVGEVVVRFIEIDKKGFATFYHGEAVLAFVATEPTDDNPEEITEDSDESDGVVWGMDHWISPTTSLN